MKVFREQLSRLSGRRTLRAWVLLMVVPALLGQAPQGPDGKRKPAMPDIHERLVKLYTSDAEGYTVFRDASRAEELTLRRKPAYVWTNPFRAGGQDGAVFIWTSRGRAELLGTFFTYPAKGERSVQHELHSLATTLLDVSRKVAPGSTGETWTPKVPGITLAAIPDTAAPERTPALRLQQMRTLARGFSGSTEDPEKNRWELRLLPQPFYRYESTDPEVLDGAVFGFVSSSGTDPETILVLEARKGAGGSEPVWHFGLARFTDMSLKVRYKGKDVFSAPQLFGPPGPDGAYRIFRDRNIPPIEAETRGSTP